MSPVIEIEHLRNTYGEKVAVADVSLAVERGEIFGILGPNGAGKTMTVEILAGLRAPDSGTVRLLGVDPQADPWTVREHLGIQLQESRLPAKITVAEVLRLYASFYAHPADPAELIDLLGLTEKRDTAFRDLSGGQQQRLSIVLALVGNPEVAVLDELTTGLDPQARRAAPDGQRAFRMTTTTATTAPPVPSRGRFRGLGTLVASEARLFLRDAGAVFFALAFPTVLLLGVGFIIPGMRDEITDMPAPWVGLTAIDVFVLSCSRRRR